MKNFILIASIIFAGLLISSCSDIREDLPESPELTMHKDGFTNPTSPNFHGNVIRNASWDMSSCKQCHAADYTGGTTGSSCFTCHSQSTGPEACNTCHGDYSDPIKISPPRSLDGSILTTSPGVGAHIIHLFDNDLGKQIECNTCHSVPTSFSSAEHLDSDGKAELIFGNLAIHQNVNPVYDFSSNKCSNSYCHGNFVFYKDSSAFASFYTAPTMRGNNFSAKWNQVDGTQTECGSCHGLPPIGHIAATLNSCVNCHSGVVNAQGEIINPVKHINGVKNTFGN